MGEGKTQQFALNLTSEKSFDVDEYIIMPSNQLLVDQLLSLEIQSSPLTILFGNEMSGKTHLSHLWQQKFNANFLPDEFLKIEEASFPALAELVASSPLIIDDIDQKNICENTIFHLINLAIQAKQPLLFTSVKPLPLWNIALPDLLSRLKAAKHIEIPSPDDMLMEIILSKTFAEKQLNVSDTVLAYILVRIERSIAAIVQLVETLDQMALQQKKPVTRGMVAKLFEDNIIKTEKPPTS
ncbi:MAG: DnaA/Hda family protein [Hyphomicrobiales bacterium]